MTEKKNYNHVVAAIIIGLGIIGAVLTSTNYSDDALSQTAPQATKFTVQGNGVNLHYAFDKDESTAWEGEEGNYYQAYYAEIDLGNYVGVSGVSIEFGRKSGQRINYVVSIQTSKDATHWTDVIGATETGFFSEQKTYNYNFAEHEARYIKVTVKTSGAAQQKMSVVEITPKLGK